MISDDDLEMLCLSGQPDVRLLAKELRAARAHVARQAAELESLSDELSDVLDRLVELEGDDGSGTDG